MTLLLRKFLFLGGATIALAIIIVSPKETNASAVFYEVGAQAITGGNRLTNAQALVSSNGGSTVGYYTLSYCLTLTDSSVIDFYVAEGATVRINFTDDGITYPAGFHCGTVYSDLNAASTNSTTNGVNHDIYLPQDKVSFGSGSFIYISDDGSTLSQEEAEETRFISYTVSTSTREVSVVAYINSSDLSDGVYYALDVSTPLYATWDQDRATATTSGLWYYTTQYAGSFASTTVEQFTFYGSLTGPTTGNPFMATTSVSVVYDSFSTTTFPGFADQTGLTGSQISDGIVENCTPWSGYWNLSLCIEYLFYPNQYQVTSNIERLRSEFLQRVPIGYAYRALEIIQTASSTLPAMIIQDPVTGQYFNLTPWDKLLGNGSILASAEASITVNGVTYGSGDSLREIIEPYWQILWLILLAAAMIHDVVGVGRTVNKKVS